MASVNYSLEFNYRNYEDVPFPFFTIEVRNPATGDSVEEDAFLDSGASRSVFMGTIPNMIGLNLLDGTQWECRTATGELVQARIHPVQVVLTEDETPTVFNLELAFSMVEIQRNLLGRDFFNLVQIGFRESHAQFFLEPTP